MKKIYLLILLCCISISGFAQSAASYGFTASSGTFNTISGTGTLVPPQVGSFYTDFSQDDLLSDVIPIGFTFNFCGVDYTNLVASTNGWMQLGGSPYSSLNSNSASNIAGPGFLMPYWDDLDGSPYWSTLVGVAYYQTAGVAPNRTFTIEYNNWSPYSSSAYGDNSFQVILHEGTNYIDFVYGGPDAMGGNSASIGIANSTSDYLSLSDPGTAPAASSFVFTTNIPNSPGDGQIYTFTPPLPCGGTPVAGTALADAITACAATTINLYLSGTTAATGLGFQWQTSADGVTGWTNIAGATTASSSTSESATAFYRAIVTCTATSQSDTSTVLSIPFVNVCYCIPSYDYFSGAATDYSMTNFNLNGYGTSVINDAGPTPAPAAGYEDRTLADTITLQDNGVYTGSVAYNNSYYYGEYLNQVWIDFNDDGTFDMSEEVTPVFGAAEYSGDMSTNFTLTVPFAGAPGYHRMRVRNALVEYSSSFSPDMDPCNYYDASYNYYDYGVTRDYTVNIIPLPPCSGAPLAGVAHADVTLACPSTAFNLSVSGTSAAGDLTYQWYSTTDSITYTLIPGATTQTYPATVSSAAYYAVVVTCPSSGLSDTSVAVFVNYLGFCYCTPSYQNTPAATYESFTNFTLTGYSGSTINDNGPASVPASGYEDRTTISVNMQQGGSYTGSITYTNTEYDPFSNQIWIDFSNDGVFDASEEVTPVFGAAGCGLYINGSSFTINIPVTANPGAHRMRIRNAYYYTCSLSSEMDPCNSYDGSMPYYYGLSRDYMVNIIALPPCTGAPVAGATVASPVTGGLSTVFTLSVPSLTVAGGLTYQWDSSFNGTTWLPISGATNPTYSFTGIPVSTYFRLEVTCVASSTTTISDSVFIPYILVPTCYPTAASWSSEPGNVLYGVNELDLTGYSGSTLTDVGITSAADGTTGYLDHTSAIPVINFQQGGTYSSSATFGYSFSPTSNQELQIWIDFNDNGTFETSEEVTVVAGFVDQSAGTTASPSVFNVQIPITAQVGNHLMRMRGLWELMYTSLHVAPDHLDPCLMSYAGSDPTYYSGVVVDYRAHIVAAPPCSGTPSAGGAVASTVLACPSTTFVLTDTGSTVASGQTYQWEFSPTGLTPWTAISGATTTTYTATATAAGYYHLKVTCTASTLSAVSDSVFVNYLGYCYCVPSYNYAPFSSYDDALANVSMTGYGGTSINDNGPSPVPSSGFQDRTFDTISFQQSMSYPGSLTDNYTDEYEYQVWIDFNNDGNFDVSEEVTPVFGNVSSYVSSASFTISIPFTAPTGYHRMRVRSATIGFFGGSFSSDMDPCNSSDLSNYYYYGTTRDYSVNIIPLPPCAGTPSAGTVTASTGLACSTSSFTLATTGATAATGLTYQWQVSSDTVTWTNIGGATTVPYTATESAAEYYRLIITCSAGGSSDTSYAHYVNYQTICPCNVIYDGISAAQDGIGNFSVASFTGPAINDNGLPTAPSSGYEDRTAISVTMQQGGSYAGSLTYAPADYNYENQIWIDFDNSGTFEVSEEVTSVFGTGGLCNYSSGEAFTINIPLLAATGVHRMRVRDINTSYYSSCAYSTDMDACSDYDGTNSYYYGQTRDYTVNIVPLCPYSITIGTTSPTCPSTPFAVSATTTASSYSWSGPGGFTSTLLNPTVTPGITVASTYTFTATNGTCVTTLTTTVDVLPGPMPYTVTPATASLCAGPQLLTVPNDSVQASGSQSFTSGSISVAVPDNSTTGVATSIDVSGIPAGATVTGVIVTLDTVAMTFDGDLIFNLQSPDGNILNLVNREGSSGHNFYGTQISSAGGTAFSSGSAPFTDIFAADAASGVGMASYHSNVSAWSSMYTSPNGTWTLATDDNGAGDLATIHRWSITINYTYPVAQTYTWSPSATLYQDAAMTIPYTGTNATQVYAAPAYPGATYTVTANALGCSLNASATVNITGATAITGTNVLCAGGATTTLHDAVPGGTWSSTVTSVAGISATGVVTSGTTSGTTVISYTMPSGCYQLDTITVNPLPAAITGATTICGTGNTTTLTDGPSGTWSNGGSTVASVSSTGVVTGNTVGSALITYTFTTTGCAITTTVNVSNPPSAITGTATEVCEGSTITLSDVSGGGSWTSSGPASVSASGVVTGGTSTGTATITYTAASGCYVTYPVTIDLTPVAIAGTAAVCELSATTLSDATPGGTWSSVTPGVATVSASGVVSGIYNGTSIISYTLGSCAASTTVTVNATPASIVGLTQVCSGGTISLSDPTSGGSWTSNLPGTAAVNSTGVVSGGTSGTAIISYTVAGGCYVTRSIAVNPPPVAISGPSAVCLGASTLFTDASGTGTWSSSAPGTASIDASGVLTGGAVGSAIVTFTYTATGCSATMPVTVNPAPQPLTVLSSLVCVGGTLTLSDVTAGGTWTSSPTTIATVDASGVVTGVSSGAALIYYSIGSCNVSATVTVNPVVAPTVTLAANPGTTVCAGTPVTFTETTTNGGTAPEYSWTKNGTAIASSTSTSYTYTPADGDVIQVVALSSLPCASPSSSTVDLTMSVIPVVTPVITVTADLSSPITAGTIVTFTATIVSGGGSAPTYQWYINGTAVSGATTNSYFTSALVNGDVVSCAVTNTDACAQSGTANGGIYNVWPVKVDNVATAASFVNVIPNPTNGTFTIKGNLGVTVDEDVRLIITDMLGQVVYSNSVTAKKGVIEQSVTLSGSLANGMYLLDVKSEHVAATFHFVLEQ